MTFSGHIATTVLALRLTQNPWVLIPAALALHLAADAVPHAEWRPWRQSGALARLIMAGDFLATLLLAAGAFYRFSPLWLVAAALVAGLLPDLTDKAARRYCRPFRRLHVLVHSWPTGKTDSIDWNRTLTGRTPIWAKIAIQTALIGLAAASLL